MEETVQKSDFRYFDYFRFWRGLKMKKSEKANNYWKKTPLIKENTVALHFHIQVLTSKLNTQFKEFMFSIVAC